MKFDLTAIGPRDRYGLLTATITPRPIAWVTTLSASGVVNAAPFSFFNLMGDDPPTIALGFLAKTQDGLKDTPANILARGEFVVNLVREGQAQAMNITSRDLAPDEDELAAVGLLPLASARVAPPRIAGAPVSFECRSLREVWTSPQQLIVIGEVIFAHVDDSLIINVDPIRIDTPAMGLVARMHGSEWYARQTDLFQMQRPHPHAAPAAPAQ